ncbi:MAG TPA: protein translocase subunit SecD [Thermodesulfobacteriota bacterium]|nr:protein translocase subunit SecD [Thermodesulfobacteriota bacterium]
MRSIPLRVALLVLSAVAAVVALLPTLVPDRLPAWWVRNASRINLGLDLQGGMHLLLEVDTPRAVESLVAARAVEVRETLRRRDVGLAAVEAQGDRVVVTLQNPAQADAAAGVIGQAFGDLRLLDRQTQAAGRVSLVYGLSPDELRRLGSDAVSQAVEILRNRVDQFGVAEPVIARQGDRQIVVQLPGVKDPKRAIELIGRTARLEFKLVVDDPAALAQALAGTPPPGTQLLYERRVDRETRVERREPILVEREAVLTGDTVTGARVQRDQFNQPSVGLTFNARGARIFADLTSANVGRRLAIVLDDTVYSAPVIREPITGGEAQITGQFTPAEAYDLAIVLRAGALPAPVRIVQNLTVGASLGEDSIRAGRTAGIIATILVVGFMLLYYRLAGLVADFALVLNVLLLLGFLAVVGATLTLPGIAGIVLGIGMAVDTNVLMFERMREELRAGRTARGAVDAGYDKAFWTIFDSHVTTLITALVLFIFGTGPVKGFAVTLSAGVLINLFTALIGTKTVFDIMIRRGAADRLRL